MFVWLCGWTVGGSLAGYTWLWNFVGQEIVVLSADTLTTKRDIVGLGSVRDYDVNSVRNLRFDPTGSYRASITLSPMRLFDGGNIAFDYGAKTYRFGGGIDEPEARDIVELLQSRHRFDSDFFRP